MHRPGLISIWFFIGVLLLAYGIIITGEGFYEILSHTQPKVVMAELHASTWWGLLLLALGGFYTFKFKP